jgi:hypothetical protein
MNTLKLMQLRQLVFLAACSLQAGDLLQPLT